MTIQNEIAGAIVMEALIDLRKNTFGFNGFPSVVVEPEMEGAFSVFLTCRTRNECTVSFSLDALGAYEAAKNFKLGKRTGGAFFEVVQKALAKLEAESRQRR